MNKTEEKPQGEAPDAYYYLGRFLQDTRSIQSRYNNNRELLFTRLNELVTFYFGSLEEDGLLQQDMNCYYHDILKDLKRDYPRFTRKRILLFSYFAARLPRSLICERTQIPTEDAVSTMRCHMITDITYHACERKAEYLDLLNRQ